MPLLIPHTPQQTIFYHRINLLLLLHKDFSVRSRLRRQTMWLQLKRNRQKLGLPTIHTRKLILTMNSKLFWFLFKGWKLGITKRFLKLNMSLKQFKKLLQKPFQSKKKDLQFATFQLNSTYHVLFRKIIHFPTG